MLFKRRPSQAEVQAEEWDAQFRARVEQQRGLVSDAQRAAMNPAVIEEVLRVHYRQMLSNPAARRQVAEWIRQVERRKS